MDFLGKIGKKNIKISMLKLTSISFFRKPRSYGALVQKREKSQIASNCNRGVWLYAQETYFLPSFEIRRKSIENSKSLIFFKIAEFFLIVGIPRKPYFFRFLKVLI